MKNSDKGFETLVGGAVSRPARPVTIDRARHDKLRSEIEERRRKLGLHPDFEAEVRKKIRAGLSEKQALEVFLMEHHRDVYLELPERDAAAFVYGELAPRLESLRALANSGPLPADIEQQLFDVVAGGVMLAEKIFLPRLEAKRAEAMQEVATMAGGDEARISRMTEDHWSVSRLREFLRYIDCAGNNTVRRIELLVEFFGEYLAETTPVSEPAK